jgi:hypothetical protein
LIWKRRFDGEEVRTELVTADAPTPDEIRRKAAEILAGPEYDLGAPVEDGVTLLQRFWNLFLNALEWLVAPLIGLLEVSPILGMIVIVFLASSACLLTGHILWTLWSAWKGLARVRATHAAAVARSIDPSVLELQASQAAEAGDWVGAVRLLFAALMRRLEAFENKPLRPGATNREHLRRYRSASIFEPMRQMVDTIDRKWFGEEVCDETDYATCRRSYEQIVERIRFKLTKTSAERT